MIHLFKRAGLNIALDVASGAVHTLDDLTYSLLEVLPEQAAAEGHLPDDVLDPLQKQYPADEVRDAFAAIQEAYQGGLLYSEDDYSSFQDHLGLAPVKAMCLHIAHDCNLRCQYCFASTGDFGGQRALMPFEVAQKAIDYLLANSGKQHNLEVDFFGGEPLLNFDVVKQTVAYARSKEQEYGKHFRFTITTNGVALNEDVIAYINENMDNIVLSLDGRKSVNDKMRQLPNGKGSYDIISPKIQSMVAQRGNKEYYVRGTYTKDNLDFDKDVLAIYDLGIEQISVEPVVVPNDIQYSIRMEDIPVIERAYERLMDEVIRRKKTSNNIFNFFHFMVDLENGPCAIKRLKGCGSGNEYIAITPEGDIYPCHQFVGNEDFRMGSVMDSTISIPLKIQFSEAHLFNKPTCMECWAKYFCSGGCNANNYNFNASILKPHEVSCALERIRLECAIAIQAALKVNLE